MSFVKIVIRKMRSGMMSYGPTSIKRLLWEQEYSGDKWNFAYHSMSDCVYEHLEKHAAGGSILDLGCGTGNTATELAMNAYCDYTGVDISDTCLGKAERRTQQNGRSAKNRFVRGDFLNYVPTQFYDVILFRESIYHVPPLCALPESGRGIYSENGDLGPRRAAFAQAVDDAEYYQVGI